ncbi:hypothetical protein VNO78_03991 [Psophocarpus tetragonolobus]|uniref:Uncharacterized protein n=1 Tax=Psophocarpus tetragonolobus TaxID=3891 RepID=A0AAN9T1A4_PSOTE
MEAVKGAKQLTQIRPEQPAKKLSFQPPRHTMDKPYHQLNTHKFNTHHISTHSIITHSSSSSDPEHTPANTRMHQQTTHLHALAKLQTYSRSAHTSKQQHTSDQRQTPTQQSLFSTLSQHAPENRPHQHNIP